MVKHPYKKRFGDFIIQSTTEAHTKYAADIAALLEESAKARGIGIAKRSPDYIADKMREGKAIIAFHKDGRLAGFTYIETWANKQYVANSGLIIVPEFRGQKLGKALKQASFTHSRRNFPDAKIFSITTSPVVMKMNTELGFIPVPLYQLTEDPTFWEGCRSCRNYPILEGNHFKHCLCTGLLYDPQEKRQPATIWKKWKNTILHTIEYWRHVLHKPKGGIANG